MEKVKKTDEELYAQKRLKDQEEFNKGYEDLAKKFGFIKSPVMNMSHQGIQMGLETLPTKPMSIE